MFLKNLLAVIVPSALAIVLSLTLNYYNILVSPNWYYGVFILCGFCLIMNSVYAYHAGSESFTQLLIGGIVIKLLFAMVVILIYSFFDKQSFFNFSLQFIMQYILFTIFEIRYLLYIIKTNRVNHD